MKIVFNQWTKQGKNVDNPELSLGSFHCGSIFECELGLNDEQKEELQKALDSGFESTWVMIP